MNDKRKCANRQDNNGSYEDGFEDGADYDGGGGDDGGGE
jgi:hypothetical protein